MKRMRFIILLWILVASPFGMLYAEEKEVFFQENFYSLANWKPLSFEKVPKQSDYVVIPDPDGGMMLKLESEKGASALISKKTFSVKDARFISWNWRVEKFPPNADPRTKSGDDYAIRVYFMFEYQPDNSPFLTDIKYRMFKTLYGEYPPDSSLNYVWSKVESKGSAFESPYTDRSKIVVLQSGQGAGERWKAEKVDLLADYQAQFGKAPPERFRLGIMTDSDNTEGKTHAFIKSITAFSK